MKLTRVKYFVALVPIGKRLAQNQSEIMSKHLKN